MALTQIQQAMLADGILTADAAGRLKMADGFVNDAKVADVAGSKLTGSRNIPKGTLPTGAVLQVVSTTLDTQPTFNSTSYIDIGLSATITPSSSSSKILVIVSLQVGPPATSDHGCYIRLVRNGNNIAYGDGSGGREQVTMGGFSSSYNQDQMEAATISHLDSPGTTSAITYKLQARHGQGSTVRVNGAQIGGNQMSTVSTITLMEIAA